MNPCHGQSGTSANEWNKPTNRVSPPAVLLWRPLMCTCGLLLWTQTRVVRLLSRSLFPRQPAVALALGQLTSVCGRIYTLAVTNVPLRNWPVLQTEEEIV